jgi:hypothetical protein
MLATELSSGINVFSILFKFNVNLFSSAKIIKMFNITNISKEIVSIPAFSPI